MFICKNRVFSSESRIFLFFCVEKPQKDIHSFIGKLTVHDPDSEEGEERLSIENTMWANTVVASGTATGLVIYTGPECRSAMNNSTLVPTLARNLTELTTRFFNGDSSNLTTGLTA